MQRGSLTLFFACYVCSDVRALDFLRASPDRELGQHIGELVRDVGKRAAAGERSTFHASVVDVINSAEEGLVNPAVSEVVAEANSLAAHALIQPDPMCNRNWSQPCPDGWSLQGRDACLASSSYAGPCKHTQSFLGSNRLDKYKFSLSCKSPWPCDDSCTEGHDYDACPIGWRDLGSGFCKSSSGVSETPQCLSEYKFDDMSILEKQEFGRICGFEWVCASTCLQDYSKQCPKAWTEMLGLCAAPAIYAGDCGYSINTTGMNENQKRSFAEKCVAAFPCLGGSTCFGFGARSRLVFAFA